jgi:hypothetical protein
MDKGIDPNLIKVLFIAYLYEILTELYPEYSQRVLSRHLRTFKHVIVTEDILKEFKALRDIINTPYIEYSYKVSQYREITSKFSIK